MTTGAWFQNEQLTIAKKSNVKPEMNNYAISWLIFLMVIAE